MRSELHTEVFTTFTQLESRARRQRQRCLNRASETGNIFQAPACAGRVPRGLQCAIQVQQWQTWSEGPPAHRRRRQSSPNQFTLDDAAHLQSISRGKRQNRSMEHRPAPDTPHASRSPRTPWAVRLHREKTIARQVEREER